jgi:hypothetical protein
MLFPKKSIIDDVQKEAKDLYDSSCKYIDKINTFAELNKSKDLIYVDYANNNRLVIIADNGFRDLIIDLVKRIKEVSEV